MESNITEQDFLNAEPALTEPHFDEEATLLSARPVVPLDEIKAKTRFRRPWVLGVAIVGMLLLGITTSAFYFSRQSAGASKSFDDSAAIASGVEGHATESGRASNSRPAVTQALPDPVTPTISNTDAAPDSPPSNSAPKTSKKPVAHLVDVITSNPGRYREEKIREARKAAREEEKERKREARRVMRDDKSPDDLIRIREIFEGRHKP
jgi:cytoskeletal protein RodZ